MVHVLPAGRSALAAVAVAAVIALLVAAGSPSAGAGAESVATHATVTNQMPALLGWWVSHDPATGAFVYHVEATDGNGVEDLDRIVLHIVSDVDGSVTAHRDDDPRYDGRRAAVWDGIARPERFVPEPPYTVELHLYDRLDATIADNRPAQGIDALPLPSVPAPGAPPAPPPGPRPNPVPFLPPRLLSGMHAIVTPAFTPMLAAAMALGVVAGALLGAFIVRGAGRAEVAGASPGRFEKAEVGRLRVPPASNRNVAQRCRAVGGVATAPLRSPVASAARRR